eukprot:m.95380 g.95380  ORF g.95380 m.95380 type:complete len:477 (-) comp26814_c0_seq1:30-1460(-)
MSTWSRPARILSIVKVQSPKTAFWRQTQVPPPPIQYAQVSYHQPRQPQSLGVLSARAHTLHSSVCYLKTMAEPTRTPSELGIIGNFKELSHKILDKPELQILKSVFEKNGSEIRLVGGIVRDLLSGIEPNDIDLSTSALPQEMTDFLAEAGVKTVPTGLQHGTITAVINHEPFEITTLRVETDHDGRHCEVQYTTDWKLDAARRDLTVNAMSMDLQGNLYDYFDGRTHLEKHIVTFVGEPIERLHEDYLRILRFFRFHGRITEGAVYDPTCIEAIKECASGLKGISGERVKSEMFKVLSHKSCLIEMKKIIDCGIMPFLGFENLELSYLEELNRVLQFTNFAMTLLVTMIESTETLERVNERWKFAIKEYKLGEFLIKYRNQPHTVVMGQNLLVEDEPLEHVRELFCYQGKVAEAEQLCAWDVPKFPVNGKMLISPPLNMEKGKALGAVKRKLKDAWIESRFVLTKEQLLELAVQK